MSGGLLEWTPDEHRLQAATAAWAGSAWGPLRLPEQQLGMWEETLGTGVLGSSSDSAPNLLWDLSKSFSLSGASVFHG